MRAEDWARVNGGFGADNARVEKTTAADLLIPAEFRLKKGRIGKFEPLYLKPASYMKMR